MPPNKSKKQSYFGSKQHKNNIRKTKLGRKYGKRWKTKAKAKKAEKEKAKAKETEDFFKKLRQEKKKLEQERKWRNNLSFLSKMHNNKNKKK